MGDPPVILGRSGSAGARSPPPPPGPRPPPAIVAAAQECGVPFNPDYNGAQQDGVSYMQFSIKDGIRQSTTAAYLGNVAEQPNLQVRVRVPARRLLVDGTRCIGVEMTHDGKVE